MNTFTLNNNEIRLEPTNKCNANCIMCPREKHTRPQGIMNIDLFKKIVDQCVECGCKKISIENFGETFLDPFIFERAKYAKTKGLETLTISNVSLIDEEKAINILKYFDVIRISMYGMTKDTYEKIHRGLCFETTKKNVDRLFYLKKQLKSNTKIHIYFLLMEENKMEKQLFLDTYENKADGVSIWIPHNWGDGREYRLLNDKKKTCGRPSTGPLQVQWDGKVVPCCYDYNSQMILGDLNTQTIDEIFKGELYNKIRKAHLENDFSLFPFCKLCDQLNRREDVLVYTNIQNVKVGSTNTDYYDLRKDII